MINPVILLIINWSATSIWLLVLPCAAVLVYFFHRIAVKRIYHEKKLYESRSLELEALLFHSKELMTRLNHEIRNPLNGVVGLSSLLQDTPLTEEQRNYVLSIRTCGLDVIKALDTTFRSAGVSVNTEERKGIDPEATRTLKQSKKLSVEFASSFPLNILVAEDDLMNQQLATMILKRLGYSPDIAPNGKEVLEMVSESKYDIILMDVQMPEMNGLEATRMIRLCLKNQPIIIAMTANAMDGDKEVCLAAGMDDYISKPVNIDELVTKLEEWAVILTGVKENT